MIVPRIFVKQSRLSSRVLQRESKQLAVMHTSNAQIVGIGI